MVTELTYPQLNYYFSDALKIQTVNSLIDPLIGTGSLRIDRLPPLGGGSPNASFAPKIGEATQGIIQGKLRAFFHGDVISSNGQAFGLMCMQNIRDMSGAAGKAYALKYRPQNGVFTLEKISAGLVMPATVLMLGGFSGPTIALQITWALAMDSSSLTLNGYAGFQSDFSDLTLYFTYTDHSPLLVTVTEGGFYQDGGSGLDFSVLVDDMGLFPFP